MKLLVMKCFSSILLLPPSQIQALFSKLFSDISRETRHMKILVADNKCGQKNRLIKKQKQGVSHCIILNTKMSKKVGDSCQ
jgi:hypothetical protein